MEDQKLEAAFEEGYLKRTLLEAEEQLAQARTAIDAKQRELVEMKKEMRENADFNVADLYSSEGFEALVSLNQNMMPVTDLIVDCEETRKKIIRLEHIIKSPYFARIDFQFEDDSEPDKIYIGRMALAKGKSAERFVYDWRSPIASVFYRFMAGKAYYDAPAGRISGELKRKRQYEIKDSRLLYFFDTDRNISDEILKQLLSKNASPKMKAIVETIQGEQDTAIRNMESGLLMVQGVAGSGKTSIALHRAAYLLYQGLQSGLSADNILIISPNTAFEQYISNVLPELGEENVVSMVFEDILHSVLKDRKIRPQNEFLEASIAEGPYKELRKGSMKYKTSEQFRQVLDRFVSSLPYCEISFRDFYFDGNCIAAGDYIKEWILRRPEVPLAVRFGQLSECILEDAYGHRKNGGGEERNLMAGALQKFFRLNIYKLYESLWNSRSYFQETDEEGGVSDEEGGVFDEEGGVSDEEGGVSGQIQKIRKHTLQSLASGCLDFDDATAILYLHLKIYGNNDYRNIRQVIIDEAQDYYPLQYEIFRMLFPNAKYTVLGDINQTLAKQETMSFYDQVQQCLKKEKVSLLTLEKSFRCTNEILQYSLRFTGQRQEIQSFNRSGDAVTAMSFDSHGEYLDQIIREVKECRERGFQTVCLICKTEKECRKLHLELVPRIELRLIAGSEMENLQGNVIIPSYMAKGLEFDAVIVCGVNARNYCGGDDKKLLYIQCTRALHRLSLFCEGEMTALAADNRLKK